MMTKDYKQYIFYPGIVIVVTFGIMVIILTFGAIASAVTNLTTNEMNKHKKYDYLKSNLNSPPKTIFSKGCLYNLKYYFHLIDAPHLETESYENIHDYIV
jgi:hypothetical protein